MPQEEEVVHQAEVEASVEEAEASAVAEVPQEVEASAVAEEAQEAVPEEVVVEAEVAPEAASVPEPRFSSNPMRDSKESTCSEVKTMPLSPRT